MWNYRNLQVYHLNDCIQNQRFQNFMIECFIIFNIKASFIWCIDEIGYFYVHLIQGCGVISISASARCCCHAHITDSRYDTWLWSSLTKVCNSTSENRPKLMSINVVSIVSFGAHFFYDIQLSRVFVQQAHNNCNLTLRKSFIHFKINVFCFTHVHLLLFF